MYPSSGVWYASRQPYPTLEFKFYIIVKQIFSISVIVQVWLAAPFHHVLICSLVSAQLSLIVSFLFVSNFSVSSCLSTLCGTSKNQNPSRRSQMKSIEKLLNASEMRYEQERESYCGWGVSVVWTHLVKTSHYKVKSVMRRSQRKEM